MPATTVDGPLIVYGDLTKFLAGDAAAFPVLDPNLYAAPSMFYQATAFLDPRYIYSKDKVNGYPGTVPVNMGLTSFSSMAAVPAACEGTAASSGVSATSVKASLLAVIRILIVLLLSAWGHQLGNII